MGKSLPAMKIAICVGILGLIAGITFVLLTKVKDKTSSQATQPTIPTIFLQPPSEQTSGNNAFAKNSAQQISLSAQKIQSGLVKKVDVQLTSNEPDSTNETAYKNSVIVAKASIQVDKNIWNELTENQKQNLLHTFITLLHPSDNTAAGIIIRDQNGNALVTGHQ